MDNSKVATKSDIKSLRIELKSDINNLKSEAKSIRSELLRVEGKVENLQDEVKEIRVDSKKMDSKLDKLQNTLDGFVGGIDELRVENTVGTHHTRELELKITALIVGGKLIVDAGTEISKLFRVPSNYRNYCISNRHIASRAGSFNTSVNARLKQG